MRRGVRRLRYWLAHKQHRSVRLAGLTLAKQCFTRYNAKLTTKRAGTNRPFFLVACFSSSKLSGKSPRVIGFFVFPGLN